MKRLFLESIDQWDGQGVLSLLGPTGSGKTRTALEWIQRAHPQHRSHPLLVSLDSVAAYRELDIGSAKPLGHEREGFDWIGLDLVSPSERLTAADFVKFTMPALEQAVQAGRPVLLVGGSHFYERALVEGMSPGQASDPTFQADLNELSNEALHERLKARDPRWGPKIHINDRYRLTRYLDLTERQGFRWENLTEGAGAKRPWNTTSTLLLGHQQSPQEIEGRMLKRIRQMLTDGWGDETRALLQKYSPEAPGLGTVGYREIVAALQNQLPWDELEERILISHMQLAKKQRTWLRGLVRRQSEL